ncbi:unnamed protein product [Aphanomyces euteiches]
MFRRSLELSHRVRRLTRALSSSSHVFPAPDTWRHAIRVVQTLGSFKQWQHFTTPTLSLRAKWAIFNELQQADEPIDLGEFMQGASVAIDVVLHAMYSESFRQYCMARHDKVEDVDSDEAALLQRVLSHKCFQKYMYECQEADKRGMLYELRHLHFTRLSLYDVHVTNSSVRLDLHVQAVQTMRVTSAKKVFLVKNPTSMLWQFESRQSDSRGGDEAMSWQVRSLDNVAQLPEHRY